MALYVVLQEQGPAWDPQRSFRAQSRWDEHARFLNGLERDRWVLLGGPVSDPVVHRAMLVVRATDPQEVRDRLQADPWLQSGTLKTLEIREWELLLGQPP